jgi:CHAT domain-containing protein
VTLPELFSQAGARNVLYTLWNVADRPAERFILDFYRVLLSGKRCGEALREVKIQWISRRETRLPFLWAVYVLTGEG